MMKNAETAVSKKNGASRKRSNGHGAKLAKDGVAPNERAMRRALQIFGDPAPESATTSELLAKLRTTLTERLLPLDDDQKIRCAACDEIATEETDFCPFCGDEGESDAETQASPEVVEEETGEHEVVEEAIVEDDHALPVQASTASSAELTSELDVAVGKVQAMKRNLAANLYDLGVVLRDIHDRDLWKARGHKSFQAFVTAELDIGRTLAYGCIDIVKQFDRDTYEKVGGTKLAIVSGIENDDARAQALESAKAGASVRELRRDAAKSRGADPDKEPTTAPKTAPKANTIALLGRVGAKAQLVKWRNAKTGRELKTHHDDAYLEIPLSEDVVCRVSLKINASGENLGGVYQIVRRD